MLIVIRENVTRLYPIRDAWMNSQPTTVERMCMVHRHDMLSDKWDPVTH